MRDQLNLPVEDFEQNLVGYALIAARAGAVPQMRIDPDPSVTAGLRFVEGRDLAALRRAGSNDDSVLSLELPRPQAISDPGSADQRWDQWSPPNAKVDIAGQLHGAQTLRQRWQRGRQGMGGPDFAAFAGGQAGVTAHAKAYQLVVPEGEMSVLDHDQLKAQGASPAALASSRALLRAQGLLFLAAFPPVRWLLGVML